MEFATITGFCCFDLKCAWDLPDGVSTDIGHTFYAIDWQKVGNFFFSHRNMKLDLDTFWAGSTDGDFWVCFCYSFQSGKRRWLQFGTLPYNFHRRLYLVEVECFCVPWIRYFPSPSLSLGCGLVRVSCLTFVGHVLDEDWLDRRILGIKRYSLVPEREKKGGGFCY